MDYKKIYPGTQCLERYLYTTFNDSQVLSNKTKASFVHLDRFDTFKQRFTYVQVKAR